MNRIKIIVSICFVVLMSSCQKESLEIYIQEGFEGTIILKFDKNKEPFDHKVQVNSDGIGIINKTFESYGNKDDYTFFYGNNKLIHYRNAVLTNQVDSSLIYYSPIMTIGKGEIQHDIVQLGKPNFLERKFSPNDKDFKAQLEKAY